MAIDNGRIDRMVSRLMDLPEADRRLCINQAVVAMDRLYLQFAYRDVTKEAPDPNVFGDAEADSDEPTQEQIDALERQLQASIEQPIAEREFRRARRRVENVRERKPTAQRCEKLAIALECLRDLFAQHGYGASGLESVVVSLDEPRVEDREIPEEVDDRQQFDMD